MSITTETRWESFEKIQGSTLPDKILDVLTQAKEKNIKGMSARQVAEVLKLNGVLRSAERQSTAPRLTELVDKGKVKVVGKVRDKITDRNVATFMVA